VNCDETVDEAMEGRDLNHLGWKNKSAKKDGKEVISFDTCSSKIIQTIPTWYM
jgi:hypothetical protein